MDKYLYQDLYELEEKHWWHKAKRRAVIQLIQRFHPGLSLKILDIGCGTGKNIETFASFGESWGIDISKNALDFCKKRRLRNVVLGSAESTNFKDRSFDLITLLDVLEHTDEKASLQEIHRIMKNKGILIINVPALPWLWSRWDEVLHHKRRYTETRLQQILNEYGFSVRFSSYWFSYLVVPTFIIRNLKSVLFPRLYPSDFRLSHPLINYLLYHLAKIEIALMMKFRIPLGTSFLCVAQKSDLRKKS